MSSRYENVMKSPPFPEGTPLAEVGLMSNLYTPQTTNHKLDTTNAIY